MLESERESLNHREGIQQLVWLGTAERHGRKRKDCFGIRTPARYMLACPAVLATSEGGVALR